MALAIAGIMTENIQPTFDHFVLSTDASYLWNEIDRVKVLVADLQHACKQCQHQFRDITERLSSQVTHVQLDAALRTKVSVFHS